jgi:hypothetical protein
MMFNVCIHNTNIKKMNDQINSKSKLLHSTNIWIKNIDNEISDPWLTICVTNVINIEQYDLQSYFVIQSRNGSNEKSWILKDEHFTKSSYSTMMEEFEYCSLLKQVNEEQGLIFDDVMHKK